MTIMVKDMVKLAYCSNKVQIALHTLQNKIFNILSISYFIQFYEMKETD